MTSSSNPTVRFLLLIATIAALAAAYAIDRSRILAADAQTAPVMNE